MKKILLLTTLVTSSFCFSQGASISWKKKIETPIIINSTDTIKVDDEIRILLGANIDAVHTARQFGIGEDRAMDYVADSEGTALNYSVMSDVVSEFREKTTISDKHFDEIRKDVKKRGGRR